MTISYMTIVVNGSRNIIDIIHYDIPTTIVKVICD
jgi:hypothetical protein